MISYIISFDLGDKFDQTDFFEILKSLGDAKQITSSTWIVVSEKTAKEIRDMLGLAMDPSERLIVLTSASPAAWRNVMCENKWLLEKVGNKKS